jgi:hypothetical protein
MERVALDWGEPLGHEYCKCYAVGMVEVRERSLLTINGCTGPEKRASG